MNFWRIATKVFAFFSLLFVSSILVKAQTDSIYELPPGTRINVRMDNEINSRVSGINDTFTATIADPVRVRDVVVVPIGTVIEGKVVKVKRAATGGKSGSLTVAFETMRLLSGEKREIAGVLVKELKAETSPTPFFLAIIGGTAIGGIFGAVSKMDNGALIGAGIGAGAGTGVALLRKGSDVTIKADEKFEIELVRKVILPVQDY